MGAASSLLCVGELIPKLAPNWATGHSQMWATKTQWEKATAAQWCGVSKNPLLEALPAQSCSGNRTFCSDTASHERSLSSAHRSAIALF